MARLSPIATEVGSTGVGVVSEEEGMSWEQESSEMGATAHAELGMMGSTLEHDEPSGLDMILDMILDMVRLRVRTAWSERLCARGAQREAPWRKCASRPVSPIDTTGGSAAG